MKQHDYMDLGKLMDDIFAAAEDFTSVFTESMSWGSNRRDFYPNYAYPPTNVYMTEEKELVFEFAVAGFREEDISLEFKGDYMLFSASVPDDFPQPENAKFFKQRLKMKAIESQKYFVPNDKFDRDKVSAILRNGILRVTVPPREVPESYEGVPIKIVKDTGSGSGKSGAKKSAGQSGSSSNKNSGSGQAEAQPS
ncbi:MAG: Hsp20/alpha crystallin family protein [Spirochaeta sp.]